jgi:hypothetical protein
VKKIETQSSGSTVARNATSMLIQSVLSGNTHMSSQGGFEHIVNTLTLLLWSSRQRIIVRRHAILVVSLAMTWPLNVLILTAVLSSTGQDGNALSHYSGRLRHDTSSFILINLLSLLLFSHMRSLFFVSLFCSEQ